MQLEKGRKLREEWGDMPCEHPNVEKEYFLGADTGDTICTQCGNVFINGNRDDIEE